MNHLNSLDFKHIAKFPSTLGDESFDCMSHGIHTCSGSKTLWKRIHKFCIDDGNGRNVVRVYANHLLLLFFVDDYVVDSCFGSSTRSCRKSNDRHSLLLSVGNSLERDYVREFWVVADDTNTLSSIHRRTTADSDDEVSFSFLASLYTHLHICNCWVWLYFVVDFIRNGSLVQYVEHHLSNAEFHQSFVCYYQGFLIAKSCYYSWQLFASAWSEIRYFVQNKSVYHDNLVLVI